MPKGTILVADDNPNIVKLIEANLEFEDYATIPAYTGEEALASARTRLPDLIILDVLMPKLDGWEVLQALKADASTRHIPVVLLTALGQTEDLKRGWAGGAEDYITKPFNPLRLLEVVDQALRKKRGAPAPPQPAMRPVTRVAIAGGGKSGSAVMQAFLGMAALEVVGLADPNPQADGMRLARDLNIFTTTKLHELLALDRVGVIIDTGDTLPAALVEAAGRAGIEVLSGAMARLLLRLLEEKEAARGKERDLVRDLNLRVRELSVLNEVARLLTSSLDPWDLLEKMLVVLSRETKADACLILMHDPDLRQFVVRSQLGAAQALALATPLMPADPLLAAHGHAGEPRVFADLAAAPASPLVAAATAAGYRSFLGIPLMLKDQLSGLMCFFGKIIARFSQEELALFSTMAGQAAIAVDNASLYESVRRKQATVVHLLGQLMDAQEEERTRIAAEIHDSVAQTLIGMLAKVQALDELVDSDPDQARRLIQDLKRVSAESIREVRHIISNLRPPSLDDLGLAASLENMCKRAQEDGGPAVALSVTSGPRLPPMLETAVYRIVQEALTNACKHAAARQVRVAVTLGGERVTLMVADDGAGFQWTDVANSIQAGASLGLTGMRERVLLLGGSFQIDSSPGHGTTITAAIPLLRSVP